MPAYLVAIREKTMDPAKLAEYVPKGTAAFEGVVYKLHAAYGVIDVLEGDAAEGVAIIEFPSMEAARQWYDSPAQQEAMGYRLQGGQFRMMIVEGMS